VKQAIANKNEKADIDEVLALDQRRRDILQEVEQLKATRNTASAEIAKKKKAGESADHAIAAMRQVGEQIAELDDKRRGVEEDLHTALSWVPNVPHESVPLGATEDDNVVVREWGEIPQRDFTVQPHWEIGARLDILDLEAAALVSGSGFYILKGPGSRLERALVNFMLDMHTADGYTEVSVPHLVTAETMFGTGQLPKLDDDMYRERNDGPYLIPTAEVPITNMFRDSIIENDRLPINLVGHTPCYRREAGSAGKDTRGMIRVHQFEKVELVKIVRPENSYDELESLVAQAEKVLQALELPYRVSTLATGDLSFAAAKCYDIELWAAGIERYLEISSISIFEDFQARRMNCRFRDEERKVRYPHTLNGSGVALARLIPAILENYQNADGTITIPERLRPYMGGMETIG
ncbi:serine--tRNA ligase, partial [candidate division GN15 bacterium]|nr:serine--tRNA ligase [candidate division GN15 bacterium]